MSLEAGTKVGRYSITRLLALGGMAEVYQAEQELTSGISRPVAVKVIRPEYSESSDFREMFLDEARTACALSHPNIVQIYDVGESEGLLYMAMELVSGEPLATLNRALREQHERFSDEALFAIGIWTASALEAAHAIELVHRDVSPHNLLLSTTGSLKLIDFGIAKAASNRNLTMPGVTKGKAGYFSPEQAMGKRLDGRSDLFSLGVTLYKLASGTTPFDEYPSFGERHAALVRGEWKDLEAVFAGLPPALYTVVRKALALKPEERYQAAGEMRDELERGAFESGFRVGQAALLGYMAEDGTIRSKGGSRSPASPVVRRPSPVPRPAPIPPVQLPELPAQALPGPAITPVELAIPVAPKRQSLIVKKAILFTTAFAASVAIGGFGMLLLVTSGSKGAGSSTIVTVVTPRTETLGASPPQDENTVNGTIRVEMDGEASGARVIVQGASRFEESLPFQNPVRAGQYSIFIRLPDGTDSPPWSGTVGPNQALRLAYDVARAQWNER